ncbi:MAG: hypothetical protein N2Z73_03090 [Endomicrobia bacterium]|nr:hypothetical protein [Endomicrobiia bacterium]
MCNKVNILFLLFLLFSKSYGWYFNFDTARTEAMASAGLSDVTSVEAVLKNPSLAFSDNFELLMDYKKFFLTTKRIDVEGFIPADINGLTVAMCFPFGGKIASGIVFDLLQTAENFYSQKMFSVTTSFEITELEETRVCAGFKPKVLYTTFGGDETERSFLFDVATGISSEKIRFSLLCQLPADDDKERNVFIGSSYSLRDGMTFNVDVLINRISVTPSIGVERWYKNLALRTGVNTAKLSFGIGVELTTISFDMSIVLPYRFYEIIPSLRITSIIRF